MEDIVQKDYHIIGYENMSQEDRYSITNFLNSTACYSGDPPVEIDGSSWWCLHPRPSVNPQGWYFARVNTWPSKHDLIAADSRFELMQ